MEQWDIAVGTPPTVPEFGDAWAELVRLSKRYKLVVRIAERRQAVERQREALFSNPGNSAISTGAGALAGDSVAAGASVTGTEDRIGEHLEGRLDAVVQGLRDVVAAVGQVEMATRDVATGGQAILGKMEAIRVELAELARLPANGLTWRPVML